MEPTILPPIEPNIYEACLMVSLVLQQLDEAYDNLLDNPPNNVQNYMEAIHYIESQKKIKIDLLERVAMNHKEPITYKA